MKPKFLPFVLFLVVLSLTALAQTGAAASPNPPATTGAAGSKVGIINFQTAVVATNEGQREFEALQKKFDPKQQELKTLNDEVENLKKQLQTQGDKLNEDARANLVKSIETKQKTLQRSLEDAQADAQREQNEVFNRVGAKVYKTLESYAKNNGYTIVIDVSNPQSGVLWAGPAVDLTKEVVDAYNKDSGVPAPVRPATAPGAGGVNRPGAAPKPAAPPAKPTTQR